MATSSEALITKLRAAFAPTLHVSAEDESSGCGAKFIVTVASSRFEGMPLLDRHRAVNAALAEDMAHIHALTIRAWTPAQWEAKKAAAA